MNGALIGRDRLKVPLISLAVGIAVKTVINVLLLKNPSFNIYGGAVALNACYFTAALINFIYILTDKVKDGSKALNDRRNNA